MKYDKAELEKYRAEQKITWDRVDELRKKHNLPDATDERLKEMLLTCDGVGQEVKTLVLGELLSRTSSEAYENGLNAED